MIANENQKEICDKILQHLEQTFGATIFLNQTIMTIMTIN
jgi:hypothetical protein